MTQSSTACTRLRELDALRGIGALGVLLFHFTTRYAEMFPQATRTGLHFPGGQMAVMLFFALSGFAIHFSFEKLTHAGDFIVARFARLFPAYWAAIAVTATVQAIAHVPGFDIPGLALAVNPTMLQSYAGLPSADGAYWTLPVELAFYCVTAMLWRAGWLARIERVLFAWLALRWALMLWPGFPEPVAQLLVLRYIHFFAIGLISYRVFAGKRSWAQQVPLIAFVLATIYATESSDMLLLAALLQLLFLFVIAGWMRWLCMPPLLWLGAISYPLYLVHQHLGMTIMLRAGEAGWNPWIGTGAALAISIITGAAIHRLVERPAGNRLLAWWRASGSHIADPTRKRTRLIELDAWRGVGALLVLNFHYATRFHIAFPAARHVPFQITAGNYRALLFFAISGFAIFFSLGRLSYARDFVAGRFARLFPAYWAAMAVTLIAEYAGKVPQLEINPLAALFNLTMLQGFFYVPAVDGAYWTLTVELAFYACMLGLWRLKLLRNIELVLLGWLGLKMLFHLWPDMPDRFVSLTILRWVPFFAIGMISHRIWSGNRSWRDELQYLLAIVITVTLTETPDLLIAAVVLIILFALSIEGKLRALCVRPLIWVGGISYSLYLVHQHVGFVILLNGDRLGAPALLSYGVAVAVAILLGALLNRYVERPAANWLMVRWKARSAGTGSPVPLAAE